MSETIKYDFTLADTVSKNLESIVDSLERTVVAPLESELDSIGTCWSGDAASAKFVKCLELAIQQANGVKTGIIEEMEELSRLTRRMFIAEEEAKRIASEEQE